MCLTQGHRARIESEEESDPSKNPDFLPQQPMSWLLLPAVFQHLFSLSLLFIPLKKGPFTYIDSSRGQMTSEMAIMIGKDSVLLKTESHEQHCNH